MELLKDNTAGKYVEEVLYRYYAKYKDVKGFFETLKEVLPKKRFFLFSTDYEEKVKVAEKLILEGKRFEDALLEAGLIDKEEYELIKNAIATGNLKEVLEHKRKTDEIIRDKASKFITTIIFPIIAFVLSFVALYIAIYNLYTTLKAVVNFPNDLLYNFLDFLAVDKTRYYFFVGGLFALIVLAFLNRRRLPVLKGVFINLEKLRFFAYLSTGLKSGLHLKALLDKYNGYFKKVVDKILLRVQAGEDIKKVFVEEISPFLSPIERANLIAGLKSEDKKEMAKALEEAFVESLQEMDKGLTTLSTIATMTTYALIGSVLYIIFVKIYLTMYDAINQLGGMG
jgi:type II secretory pathway component PulF